ARDLADLVGLVADDDRVPRVGAALVAADEVGVLREEIDDLPLALVAPLRPDDHGRGHFSRSLDDRPAPPNVPSASRGSGAERCASLAVSAPPPAHVHGPRGLLFPAARDDRRPAGLTERADVPPRPVPTAPSGAELASPAVTTAASSAPR